MEVASSRPRGLVLPTLAAVVVFAVLCALGTWQLQRMFWKEALIAQVEAGLAADPVPAPGPSAWPALDMAAAEYQPVELHGTFDHDREIHVVYTLVKPKGPHGGIGYQIVTPFRTDEGWWVYVNRGFVPRERRDAATRAEGQTPGEVTVVGLMRQPGYRSWFMPSDDAAANSWFSRDPVLFAEGAGLAPETVAPYLVDARFDPDLPGGLPQGGETIVRFSNNHLQYVVTWYGLAVALAAVYIAFVIRRRNG